MKIKIIHRVFERLFSPAGWEFEQANIQSSYAGLGGGGGGGILWEDSNIDWRIII